MAQATESATESIRASDLTAFQQTLLVVLAEEARYGLAIKHELEAYYGEEINHGRLYPNLDELADRGLIEIGELDKRTNEYALTSEGREVLLAWFEWLFSRYVTDEERAADLRTRLDGAL